MTDYIKQKDAINDSVVRRYNGEIDCAIESIPSTNFVKHEGFDGVTIDRLRELAQADREGRCLVLPCRIGDTVWTNISMRGDRYRKVDRPYPIKIVYIGMGEETSYFNGMYSNERVLPFEVDNIGQTVFLTREEAEAALRREQDD